MSTSMCTSGRLTELEATIERGLEAYIQTGQALAEIRDTHAYLLAGYPSFNAYLEGRWDMSRRQAFNLLAASSAVHELVQTFTPACDLQATPEPIALPTFTQAVELARLQPPDRHDLVESLERPLSDYSTRELQRRARAFKQELQARRPGVGAQERSPQWRRLESDDIQIEVLDAARTTFDDGLFDLLISSPPFALDVPYADGGDVPDYATYRDRCLPAWSAELYRISNPVRGRLCLEVAFDRSKNGVYEPVYHHWVHALPAAGFRYRTTVFRRYHAGRGTARGSIDSPSGIHTFAPVLAIIVVYRGKWVRHCDHPYDLEHDD
jgi:hypothetical protein